MLDVLELLISWGATTLLSFVVLGFDERRLPPDRLERAWPVASKRNAVVVFGGIAILIHFVRTRRSAVGLLLGFASTFLVSVAAGLVTEGALEAARALGAR